MSDPQPHHPIHPAPHDPDIDRHLATHGFSVVAVLAPLPDAPRWSYTVGLTRTRLPELLVFGRDEVGAHRLLTALRSRLLHNPRLARADTVIDGVDGGRPVRLGEVAPRWLATYPLEAVSYYGPDVEVLQVITTDESDHVSPGACALGQPGDQPDLARTDLAWPTPLLARGYLDPPEGDVHVLVPIVRTGQSGGDEMVPAALVEHDRARLLRPPILADWVTADTEVRVTDPPLHDDLLRVLAPVLRGFSEVTRVSPRAHLTYETRDHEADHLESLRRISRDLESFDARFTFGTCTVTIAVPALQATRVRLALRHLERDGLVTACEPYHRPAHSHHDPRCRRCRRELSRGA